MNSDVRLLHHPTSQPCRSVHQLLLENQIPFQEEIVNLMDGDNEEQSFKDRYNPTGQVPILCDGDFVVWESAAIASRTRLVSRRSMPMPRTSKHTRVPKTVA